MANDLKVELTVNQQGHSQKRVLYFEVTDLEKCYASHSVYEELSPISAELLKAYLLERFLLGMLQQQTGDIVSAFRNSWTFDPGQVTLQQLRQWFSAVDPESKQEEALMALRTWKEGLEHELVQLFRLVEIQKVSCQLLMSQVYSQASKGSQRTFKIHIRPRRSVEEAEDSVDSTQWDCRSPCQCKLL